MEYKGIITDNARKELEKEYQEKVISWSRLKTLTEKINRIIPLMVTNIKFDERIILTRKKLYEFFRQNCSQICKNCPATCCADGTYQNISIGEIFYYSGIDYLEGKSFKWPEPDWSHIKNHPRYIKPEFNFVSSYCLFHSNQGCLLKERKPENCLTHICFEIYRQRNFAKEIDKELQQSRSFLRDCQKKQFEVIAYFLQNIADNSGVGFLSQIFQKGYLWRFLNQYRCSIDLFI